METTLRGRGPILGEERELNDTGAMCSSEELCKITGRSVSGLMDPEYLSFMNNCGRLPIRKIAETLGDSQKGKSAPFLTIDICWRSSSSTMELWESYLKNNTLGKK